MARRPTAPSRLSDASLDAVAGALLRSLRFNRGRTLEAIAEAAEITPEELTAYEEGTVGLPVAVPYDLAPVLGTTPAEFVATFAASVPRDERPRSTRTAEQCI